MTPAEHDRFVPRMSRIELEKDARDALARRLCRHVNHELGLNLEPFDAVLLLDFMVETVGPYVYNQALRDVRAVLQPRLEQIGEAIYEIEKPLKL